MAVYKETDGNIVREYLLREGMPVFRKQTERALVEIVPTKSYGTALFIDNELQLTEKDEYIYHEMLVHPCLTVSGSRKHICIIGGGDGCAAREVLKWGDELETITIIDWDSEVTTLFTRTYEWLNSNSLTNPKVKVEHANIRELLHEQRSYDCILIDLLDPNLRQDGQIDLWYDCLFLAKHWIREDGAIVINGGGVTPWETDQLASFLDLTQKKLELPLHLYKAFVPSFGREWCFLLFVNSTKLNFELKIKDLRYMSTNAWNHAYSNTWTPDYHKIFHLNA